MPAETSSNTNGTQTDPVQAASEKKKQILVVVLLAALLVALMMQPQPETEDSAQKSPSSPVPTKQATTPKTPTEPPCDEPPPTDWLVEHHNHSRLELNQIIATPLFATEPQEWQKRLANRPIPPEPVKAIYGTLGNQAALVGQTIIRSGQALPAGGKVLSVTTDGIQITP